MRRIGVLVGFDQNDPEGKRRYSAFTQALAGLGWTDGRNVRIDLRWAAGDTSRFRALAQELVGLQPDIILANSTPATAALQGKTRTIPIVFAGVGDPVASGIVERLDRPSGNTTGFAGLEPSLGGKWIELLSEIAPGLKRAGIMFNPDLFPVSVYKPLFEAAARSLKVAPIIAAVHSDVEIEAVITALGREPGSGFVVMSDAFTQEHRAPIISAAARNNVPAVYTFSYFARDGGLLSYGPDVVDQFRRAATYVDRILRGEKPGDLPVQSDKIRDGCEPQDCQGARPCHIPIDHAARRRGDRMTNRREFIAALGGAAAWPLAAHAQQGDRVRRIGVLTPLDENDPSAKTFVSAFIQSLAGLGWTAGRNVRMDLRSYGDDINRMRALAQELVGSQPDIILASSTPATAALQQETRTIPIVFVGLTDPVATGIVERLNRPSGNVTGFADFGEASLGGKWLELLWEIAPRLKRATIMFNPDTSTASTFMPSLEAAARLLKIVPIITPVHSDVEIEAAIIALGREPGGGLVVMPDVFMTTHRAPIILAAARNYVPAVYSQSYYARDGGLLSYGVDRVDIWRRAASYVDRILRGAKPGDLPVQLPTKYEMAVNLKTAKALGLTVPLTLLAIADEQIE
jgi:putative ABC transport system substrate-binding protein